MPLPGAGDLHQTVQWAEPFGAMDRYGNEQTGWANRFVVRAQIAPKLGGEDVMAARLQGRQPVVIRVRNTVDTARSRRTGASPIPTAALPTTFAPSLIHSWDSPSAAAGSRFWPRAVLPSDA